MISDHLQRLYLEDINARIVVVHLDGVVREVLGRGHYPQPVADLLAQALLVAALCSSGIKFSGRLSIQLRSTGPLKLLLADCTAEGGLRGIARFDHDAVLAARGFSEMTEGGVLTLTLEPAGRGRIWQGIVPLEGAGLAEAMEGYFRRSEQLPSRIRLAVAGERASGILVQSMPGEAADPDGWQRIEHLLSTLGDAELLETDSETLLHRLFHEEDRRLFPARGLEFHCPCNRERVAGMLRGLGAEELGAMLEEQSEVEVSCEFCDAKYSFDRLDIHRLLVDEVSPEVGQGGAIH